MSSEPTRSPSGPAFVQMNAITRNGERMFMDLDRHHQESLLRAMSGPVLRKDCKLVKGPLAKYRVRRFGAADFLCVTYREFRGWRCVLHAGTHADADDFAKHYDGNLPVRTIPIQESIIMKTRPVINSGNGHHKNGALVSPLKPEVPRDLANEGDLLLQAIVLIADKAMEEKKRQLIEDIDAMGDLVRGQVEELTETRIAGLVRHKENVDKLFVQCADQARFVYDEVKKLDRAAKDLGSQLGEMSTRLEKQTSAAGEELAGVAKSLGQLEAGHKALALRCHEKTLKADQCIASLSNQMLQMANSLAERDKKLHAIEHRLQTIESRLGDPYTTDKRLDEVEASISLSDARTQRLDSDLTELADSVTAIQASLNQQAIHSKERGLVSTILRLFRGA